MIDATLENSGSGKVNSLGNIQFAAGTLGTNLVDGYHHGNDSLDEGIAQQIREAIVKFEEDLKYPIELEFAVRRGKLYFLQIRKAALTANQQRAWIKQTKERGSHIWRDYINSDHQGKIPQASHYQVKATRPAIIHGTVGIGAPISGYLALTQQHINAIKQSNGKPILFSSTSDAHSLASLAMSAGAIVTTIGNEGSHLYDVAIQAGLSLISGAAFNITTEGVKFGEEVIRPLQAISIDPDTRSVFPGSISIEVDSAEVDELTQDADYLTGAILPSWAAFSAQLQPVYLR